MGSEFASQTSTITTLESRVSVICSFSLCCFSQLSVCMDDFFSIQHEESSAESGISTSKVGRQSSGDRQVSSKGVDWWGRGLLSS